MFFGFEVCNANIISFSFLFDVDIMEPVFI